MDRINITDESLSTIVHALANSLETDFPSNVGKLSVVYERSEKPCAEAEQIAPKNYKITITSGFVRRVRSNAYKLIEEYNAFPWISDRLNFAEALFRQAIEVVFLHEVGHILYGHVTGSNCGELMNRTKIDGELLSQILEWDADTFAMNHCITRGFEICDHLEQYPTSMHAAYKTRTEFMILLVSATHLLFNLDARPVDFEANPPTNHPPAPIRKHTAIATCWEILKANPKESYTALLFPTLAAGVGTTVDAAFLPYIKNRNAALKPFSPESEQYISELKNQRTRILPDLAKFWNLAPLSSTEIAASNRAP